jgi:hypothetical protein
VLKVVFSNRIIFNILIIWKAKAVHAKLESPSLRIIPAKINRVYLKRCSKIKLRKTAEQVKRVVTKPIPRNITNLAGGWSKTSPTGSS